MVRSVSYLVGSLIRSFFVEKGKSALNNTICILERKKRMKIKYCTISIDSYLLNSVKLIILFEIFSANFSSILNWSSK